MSRASHGADAIRVAVERPDRDAAVRLLAQLDAYLTALYPPESNHLLDVAALLRPDVRFFIARRAGAALGCGALRLDAVGCGELKRMFVVPAARGLGVGRTLLREIEEHARRLGLHTLRLETGIHQPAAIGLYLAAGYSEIGPFGDYRPDPLSRFFAKPLGEAVGISDRRG